MALRARVRLSKRAGLLVPAAAILLAGGAAATPSASDATPRVYSLTAAQAHDVAVTVAFVDAYNGRRLAEAMALLDATPAVSDCDYRARRGTQFTGRDEVEAWLRGRFRDRDQLRISRIWNANPSDPVGVLGVDWGRRESRTLRSLGYRDGVVPQLAAKVIFERTGRRRIDRFANGGASARCVPVAAR